MKSYAIKFIVLVLVCGSIYITSCSEKNPTTGTLGVTVIDSLGNPVIWNSFYMATSLDNLRNRIYSDSGTTDEAGKVRFLYLTPNYYWYRVKNWANYSGIQIYAGHDYYTTFEITDPADHK